MLVTKYLSKLLSITVIDVGVPFVMFANVALIDRA